MKIVYCSNCGKQLQVYRKALTSHSRIIDLVEWHECLDEPLDLNLEPLTTIPLPNSKIKDGKDKFVQKLNDLPAPSLLTTNNALLDHRPVDQVKSTAPMSILESFKSLSNSIPAHSIEEDPSDG
jgi:hypothetical protein